MNGPYIRLLVSHCTGAIRLKVDIIKLQSTQSTTNGSTMMMAIYHLRDLWHCRIDTTSVSFGLVAIVDHLQSLKRKRELMRGCLKVVLYRLDCKACLLRQPDSQDAMSNGWHHSAHGAMSEIGGPGVFRGWTAFRHHSALVEVAMLLLHPAARPAGTAPAPPE